MATVTRRPDVRVTRADGTALDGFSVEGGTLFALFHGDQLVALVEPEDVGEWGTVKSSNLARARAALEAGTHEPIY